MSGARRKFGFDLETVPAMLERIRRDAVLEFVGFHLYAGTQCFDARHWLENAHYLVDFATRIEKDLDVPVKTLNFGGGFGVECFEGDSRFDLEAAGKGLSSLLRLPEAARRRHFIELGRYLTAPAGIYVTRVISIRRRSDVPYIVLDGGLHHHAAAAGVGSLIPRPFPLVRVRSPLATHSHTYAIGGPLCTSLDEFAEEVCLPELMEGDLVAVLASGAYGLTYSNVLFLSHPTPAEVLLDRSGPALVRRRGRPEDALLGQLLPEAAC